MVDHRRPIDMEPAAWPEPPPTRCPHLGPLLCSLAAVVALLGSMQAFVDARVPGDLPFYAAHAMSFKINGNVLPAAAFRTPNELPVYGSSELDLWVDNRADAFFARRPSGFAVFPVGRGGVTCLLIAQKLAAVGSAARGKKVVIFLSSNWFMVPGVTGQAVGTNLGIPQVSRWVFGGELSPSLKTGLARRLQDFPDPLKNQTLLAAAVRCLAEPTPWNRLRFALLSPLGKLQNTLLARFDHGVILGQMIFPQNRWRRGYDRDPQTPPMAGGHIDWDRLTDNPDTMPSIPGHPLAGGPDAGIPSPAESSREFADLELLVRVLGELRMKVLFIGQPANRMDHDTAAATARSRRAYHERLQALVGASGYLLRDFSGREEDPSFFSDAMHPSAKMWLLYDREIDRFYASTPDGS